MEIYKYIILILSLYGIASTITFIVYIIKYQNLNNKFKKINNTETINNELKESNNTETINEEFTEINNISNIIAKYDIYYNFDLYNKYDLKDEFNDNIIIYSNNLSLCYIECEKNINCYGFSKYHNYCYLKGLYNLTNKINANNITLILNPNISNINEQIDNTTITFDSLK